MLIGQIHSLAKAWAIKLLLALVILSFTVVGVSGLLLKSPNTIQSVVTVDTAVINTRDFTRIVTAELNRLNPNNTKFTPEEEKSLQRVASSRAVQSAIKEAILLNLINKEQILIDSDVIENSLISSKSLQDESGKFSSARLEQLLASNNISEEELLHNISKDTSINWLTGNAIESAVNADIGAKNFYSTANQQRKGAYIGVSIHNVASNIEVTKKEVDDFYVTNKKNMITAAKIKLRYISVKADKRKVDIESITEDMLQDLYKKINKVNLADRAVGLRHILLKSTSNQDKDETRVEKIRQLLMTENFAQVAKDFSEDKETAENGGLLEVMSMSIMPKSFQEVVPTLQVGQWHATPLKSEFGWHFIMLESLDNSNIKSFADMKKELMSIEITKLQNKKLIDLRVQADELVYLGTSFQDISTKLGIRVKESVWLYADLEKNPEGIGKNKEVVAAIFKDNFTATNNPIVISNKKDQFLVLLNDEYKKPSISPLKDVSPTIKKQIAQNKASKLISESLVSVLNSYKNKNRDSYKNFKKEITIALLKKLPLQRIDIKWKDFDGISRYNSGVEQELTNQIFAGSVSALNGNKTLEGGNVLFTASNQPTNEGLYYISAVQSISMANFKDLNEQELDSLISSYNNNLGQELFSIWLNHKVETSNVVVNKELFK